ncbi:ATP-binding cassette domain-containing protein [Spirochaeta lutea]|uniref:ATP-binding cassette domain-containing protein n=1 Tax=Spirochaeta lutea TaxID=1480694 RepID=UPI000A74EFB5|nr:ATP-binding cassette domain-containing protein [Spirochaeta lutea]
MDPAIRFQDISFFYVNQDAPENIKDVTPQDLTFLFDQFSLDLPKGVLSIVGENGTGKSTLLLLAGGRLFPIQGSISILGRSSQDFRNALHDPELERERAKLVSYVYQNMEFESDHSVGDLMNQVFSQGFHPEARADLIPELVTALSLDNALTKRTQELSKGALQRAVIAFAVLYGSQITMMDEPVFAMEEPRKEATMEYLQDYARRSETSLYFTAHNLHLCEQYSDQMLILKKGNTALDSQGYILGPTAEVCTRENLEQAYKVPYETLHRKEGLYRDMLMKRFADGGTPQD